MSLESIVFIRSYVLYVLNFVVISLMYVSMSVCLSVCLCVCLFPRREVISQPILKYDISTDAYFQPKGVPENRFKIKPEVEKLFRKNLIKQLFFDRF